MASPTNIPPSALITREASKHAPTYTPSQPATPKLTSYFSQSQTALALMIAKSKPERTSLAEYCQLLSKRITTGKRAAGDNPRYVGSVEFWKDQYSMIDRDRRALEAKYHILEEKHRLLREHTGQDNQKGGLSPGQEPLAQRHGVSKEDLRKRQALDDLEIMEDPDDLHLPNDPITLGLSSYMFRILQQRSKLEKLIEGLKDLERLEHLDEAIKCSLQILMLLENALTDCVPLLSLRMGNQDPQTCEFLQKLVHHQVFLGFQSCFVALDNICATIPGRTKKSVLVNRMVMFFNKTLDFLQTFGNLQAEIKEAQNSQRLRNKRAKIEKGEYAMNEYLGRALSAIVSHLGWQVGKPHHSEILEGILFSILKHTGHLLSDAIFSEHVANSTNPGHITQGTAPLKPATAKPEFRYIVQILRAALGSVEKKELVAKVLASDRNHLDHLKRINSLAPSSSFTRDLVSNKMRLIQSTLTKFAVGRNDLASLELPLPPVEESNFSIETVNKEELYSSVWLIEEVWALIGWEKIVGED
ncbi:hypothetical protein LSUB1_G003833 [Lachnellula subtilissima]|uniref:Uncharacterized protein n=1 Tax=Lachnellula subtilissima TaxID=602034 RepID=A0A8H8RNX7_9HELO|nr:hypothetical protein LSUB1_G003833 [Lachnellula subtilissima]